MTTPYYGGLTAVHETPLLFPLGNKPIEAVHRCAGPGCATCLWASWGIVRSHAGFWYGWDGDKSVVIDSDSAAVRVRPEDLGLK
jgi:hypothetical protein